MNQLKYKIGSDFRSEIEILKDIYIEAEKVPEKYRKEYIALLLELYKSKNMEPKRERTLAFSIGLGLILLMILLAIIFPKPTSFQYLVFRITLALACSAFSIPIPGFINVSVKNWVKAGGALAVFVVVYYFDPAHAIFEMQK